MLNVVAEHARARIVPEISGAGGSGLHLRHAFATTELGLVELLERGQSRGNNCSNSLISTADTRTYTIEDNTKYTLHTRSH